MSLCFLIPVKLETPAHQGYLKRCLASVRTHYPTTPVYIVCAPGTQISLELDATTHVVQNPSFSTLGALQLFEENHYADTACILHDSMVLLAPLPSPLPELQFLYHFESNVFEHSANVHGYRRIVPAEADELLATLRVGCFGNTCILRHDRLRDLCLTPLYSKVKTKYDFECMERILAFRVQKAGHLRPSLCGNILDPISDPWRHTEYASMTLDQLRQISFPHPILKACLGRK
jgi:hypothetical protein